jgi:hypothetical protein
VSAPREREHETQVAMAALREYVGKGEELPPRHRAVGIALLDDLRSGETTLANCGDDECSHGWHYTQHGDLQAILVDLGGRSALALLLSVLMVCATVLLLAEMVMAGSALSAPSISGAFTDAGAP